jgi:virulence-associated protein VapD
MACHNINALRNRTNGLQKQEQLRWNNVHSSHRRFQRQQQSVFVGVRIEQHTMTMMVLVLLASLHLFWSEMVVPVVSATPVILVQRDKPRCVIVESPQDTVLRVDYDAPGKLVSIL